MHANQELLRNVSRSFYLTLRVLPRSIRPQISLAYLLARATDTIADTEAVPLERRLETLRLYRDRILGQRAQPIAFRDFVAGSSQGAVPANECGRGPTPGEAGQPLPPEQLLLTRIEEVLALLRRFSAQDQRRIRELLSTIVSGQELDLERFGRAQARNITALQTEAELDDYTWRVAGCVGEFWTHLCRDHVFSNDATNEDRFLKNGIRFGKGLQLVNILRDLSHDLRLGRCYLPTEVLATAGLKPHDLLDPSVEAELRPVYDHYLALAYHHLEAGWDYTNTVPGRFLRLRLACALPILIGVQTLARLRMAAVLEAGQRVKISRPEVRRIVRGAALAVLWPPAWRRLFGGQARALAGTMPRENPDARA